MFNFAAFQISTMKLGDSDTLYIRISRSEFVFARYDRLRQQTVNFETYVTQPDISINANMHEAIRRTSLVKGDFSYVRVLVEGPATLVPLSDFDEDHTEDIYFFNFSKSRKRHRVFYDTLPHLNAVLLFAIDKDICHTLEETFPNLLFQSAETPLLLHFASACMATTCGRFFVNIANGRIGLSAFRDKKLGLYNTCTVHHLEDVLYFTLQTMHLWHFRRESDELYLCGEREQADELLKMLTPYVPHISVLKPEEEFNANVAALLDKLPYDLVLLMLRAY